MSTPGYDEALQDPMLAYLDALLMNSPAEASHVIDQARRWREAMRALENPPTAAGGRDGPDFAMA